MSKRTTIKQEAEINKNSLMTLIKTKTTLDEKRELVRERNPFLHIFGEKLLPQGNNDYATYINKLYLGE
jgi:hypothetical protein